MPGIRLHPNYHGYELRDPVFAELLHVAAASGLIVQLVVSMEDIRTQHPLMRMPPVDLSPLAQVVKTRAFNPVDAAQLVAVAAGQRLQPLPMPEKYISTSPCWKALKESPAWSEQLPPERVLFGSNFPLFHFEAALLKVQESGLPERRKTMLFEGNARRILAREGRQ